MVGPRCPQSVEKRDGQALDRVEFDESDTVSQLNLTYSLFEAIVRYLSGTKCYCSFCTTDPPLFAFGIRVLEPERMPSATQVIQLLSISEQRGEMMTSTVPMKPASRGVRLDVLVDSFPAQLENDEMFILPSAVMFQWCFPFFLHTEDPALQESRSTE